MADPLTPQQMEQPISPPEHVSAEHVDRGAESVAEQRVEQQERPERAAAQERSSEQVTGPRRAPTASAVSEDVTAAKDDVARGVEKILEEDLGGLYASLDPIAQQKFREHGETVAKEISQMVRTFKVRVSRVVRLIRDWLLMIPRVNKYFLEQEAKIKTDEIVAFANERGDHPPVES